MKIRKAVFPVAGLGTRVLPATKAMPKEMLTIVDKPLIQYVYDEAKEAGIEHFVFVTGRNKAIIEDHFDRMFELDTTLATRGKKAEIEVLAQNQPEAGAVSFTRQQAPHGLGHAVWCARDIVGDEPFAVVLPDELVLNTPGCLAQMIDAASRLPLPYEQPQAPALREVRTAALAAAGGAIAGVATVAAVRAVSHSAARKRPQRRLIGRSERPVVASRSFLIDVHLLGK